MSLKDPLLECCRIHQWSPRHLDQTGRQPVNSTSVDAEAREALRQGQASLCLALIEIARSMKLQSVEQLELKAAALQQSQQANIASHPHAATTNQTHQILIAKLLEQCQSQQWTPQFLQIEATSSDLNELLKTILKEAETARNNEKAGLSLELLNISINHGLTSPWFFHLKARALQELERFDEAISIWETLATNEIEGLSDKVQSALKTAKEEQTIQKARKLEAAGCLDSAIEALASALLNDPDQGNIETKLKAMLRKRRHASNGAVENSPTEDHLDELDLNNVFLIQAEQRLASTASQ